MTTKEHNMTTKEHNMTTKTPKLRWKLSTRDYDIKTYKVFHGDTPIGFVDVEYHEGRIENRVATPKYEDTLPVDTTSRKDANAYLWGVHLEQTTPQR